MEPETISTSFFEEAELAFNLWSNGELPGEDLMHVAGRGKHLGRIDHDSWGCRRCRWHREQKARREYLATAPFGEQYRR